MEMTWGIPLQSAIDHLLFIVRARVCACVPVRARVCLRLRHTVPANAI